MKIKREKRTSRILNFYKTNFGFREPYQVLVDGTFCQAACRVHMRVTEHVTSYLGTAVKLLTTCCAVIETENLGGPLRGAAFILKNFALHKCGHQNSPVSGAECLASMVVHGNPNHYIIASQDKQLRSKLRKSGVVPLLQVFRCEPLLEEPSISSKTKGPGKERSDEVDFHMSCLRKMREGMLGPPQPELDRGRMKKKRPNHMSCLKKKQKKGLKSHQKLVEEKASRSRKRRRIRVPKHVKECLLQSCGVTSSWPATSSRDLAADQL